MSEMILILNQKIPTARNVPIKYRADLDSMTSMIGTKANVKIFVNGLIQIGPNQVTTPA